MGKKDGMLRTASDARQRGRGSERRGGRRRALMLSGAGALATVAVAAGAFGGASAFAAAGFDSTVDPNALPMIQAFSSLPKSTLDQNDQLIISINNNATAAEKAESVQVNDYPSTRPALANTKYLGPVRDAWIAANDAGEVPLANALLAEANYNSASSAMLEPEWASTDNAKNVFKYPRPYCRLSQVKPTVHAGTCPNTYGFPSGHNKIAWTEGVGLAVMLPELAPQILARTAEIGNARVVAGVHYPLDVIASRAIATRWIAVRLHDDVWRAKFDAAKTQLRTAIEKRCGTTIADCLAKTPTALPADQAITIERDKLTYGFAPIGAKGQAMQVPDYAYELIAWSTGKTKAESDAIIAQTAIDSGYPLDTTGQNIGQQNIGWTRIDLGSALQKAMIAAPVVDTTAPVAQLSGPANGSTVKGASVALTGTATDNVAVTKVQILVDGVVVSEGATSPLAYTWDSTKVADGAHKIEVAAFDAAGNRGVSAAVSVTVSNAVIPTPTPTQTSVPTPKPTATTPPDGGAFISYGMWLKGTGWQNFVGSGQVAGTTGQSLRAEGLRGGQFITGTAHVQDIGWMNSKVVNQDVNGSWNEFGKPGSGKRLEAITLKAVAGHKLTCQAHVQNIGWMAPVSEGKTCGTTGKSLRLEAVIITLDGKVVDGIRDPNHAERPTVASTGLMTLGGSVPAQAANQILVSGEPVLQNPATPVYAFALGTAALIGALFLGTKAINSEKH